MNRGVFGGSFNPLHRGHLHAARLAMEAASLEEVLFVPAQSPPHKNAHDLAGSEDRLAMVTAAVADEDGFSVSMIEMEPDGPRYTIETLRALRSLYPGDNLSFIMGMDSLVDLPTWRLPERILEEFHVIAVDRPGLDPRAETASLEGRLTMVTGNPLAISGTAVRERVARGLSIRHLVSEPVERYIHEKGLYHTPLPKA